MKNESGVFTSGTKRHLKTHTPEVELKDLPKTEVHKNGEKGEPFTASNKKRLNKEIKAQAHPSVKHEKIQDDLYEKDPFTHCTQERQTDRMEGASPRIKNKKIGNWNQKNDFMADTTREDGAVMDGNAKGSN